MNWHPLIMFYATRTDFDLLVLCCWIISVLSWYCLALVHVYRVSARLEDA